MAQPTASLREQALALGFTNCGVCTAGPVESFSQLHDWLAADFHGSMDYMARHAELRRDPRSLLPSARSVIAVSLNYYQDAAPKGGEPRIARYALGRDYHRVVRGKLKKLQAWLTSEHAGAECRICVDSAPLLEREIAHRAGLGWFGKNTMLIDSRTGSWFLLGFLLTSIEFEPSKPSLGGCGTCSACIDACPTGAIVHAQGRWQVDARRCISYLTIEHRGAIDQPLMRAIGDWTFGCDVCQEVCPFNQPRESQPDRATSTQEPDFLSRRQWPNLKELAQIGDDEFKRLAAGSPVARARPDGIRRNAQINLENK
ncbi:MAG: tRNA epoxyqueuosine(34) reductase QueG [Armatimonadetes bacterium]|nr:tRNA epoxyqueuosine(34) reductase QueG [Armatimonadota bacterium]